MFFLFSLTLMFYDYMSAIEVNEDNAKRTCGNNVFTGSWQPLNALNYFIVRWIAGFSASLTALYLFWKVRPVELHNGSYIGTTKKVGEFLNDDE